MQFTQEELKNILALINRAQISGTEAVAVANLQLKISSMIKQDTQPSNVEPSPENGVSSTGEQA